MIQTMMSSRHKKNLIPKLTLARLVRELLFERSQRLAFFVIVSFEIQVYAYFYP